MHWARHVHACDLFLYELSRLLLNRLPTPNEAGLLALLCKKPDRSCTYSSDLMTRQEDEDSFIFHVAVGKYIQPTIALHSSMVKKTKTA